jgi:threonine/homoserine/homoserine lactone efflux protein
MLLGFSIAAPVGPIGLLCIRRTLVDGRLAGFVSGLGVATADLIYGSIAAFGLTAVSGVLTGNAGWIRLIGGAFLLYLGVQTYRMAPATRAAEVGGRGLLGSYTAMLMLTLTNPLTILAFTAMFAALGAGNTGGDYGNSMLVALGVFLGSTSWWLLLSGSVGLIRRRVGDRWMRSINRGSGVLIVAFGLVSIWSSIEMVREWLVR